MVELTASVKVDQRLYNRLTTSEVVGSGVEGNENITTYKRSIVVYGRSEYPTQIQPYFTSYDHLSYLMFFPNGEAGWHSQIPREGVDIRELDDADDDVAEDEEADKLANPDYYDKVVCAKIPDLNKHPELHHLVLKHMIHGPCGHLNTQCPCMKGETKKCHWNYPRQFQETTQQGDDSYPLYRRRDNDIESMGKSLSDFYLPNITANKNVYDTIMRHVDADSPDIFFIDGLGGTGKTFLYKALLAIVCFRGHIALATASSGAAANDMTGGRTAHSRFKIPINLTMNSICNIKKQIGLAKLLCQAKLIIWDEASMAKRQAVEAVDRTTQDIIGVKVSFGGKIMVLGGDFRQVLSVIRRGTRAQIVDSNDMTIPYTDEKASKDALINEIFPLFATNVHSSRDIVSRAILSTKNEHIDSINDLLIDRFPSDEKVYYSFDEAEDDTRNLYPLEFLNSLNVNGFPPNCLRLKIGCPIILLRNLDLANGLCNVTRLICKRFDPSVIDAEIVVVQLELDFAMTINKAQGQTIPNVGVYMADLIFSHGQLYIALSIGISRATTKVLVKPEKEFGQEGVYTSNVVYQEVLRDE
ncbi:ATP-dependent DNA helicase PIF1-like protein [Tanacetum coccineum]